MSKRFLIPPGEYAHIYNRGTDGRLIFADDHDRDRFILALYLANGESPFDIRSQRIISADVFKADRGQRLVDIIAYCLMPNHFHLCIRGRTENGASRFMHKFSIAYTNYFNARHSRSGALFQGKYKIKHEKTSEQIAYLISYIHLNPVKLIEPTWKKSGIKNRKKAEHYIEHYVYSSYMDYLGVDRAQGSVLQKDSLPSHFVTPGEFKKEVATWLTYKDEQ